MLNYGVGYVGQLFHNNVEIKDWGTIVLEFNLENKFCFSWMQMIDSVPVS